MIDRAMLNPEWKITKALDTNEVLMLRHFFRDAASPNGQWLCVDAATGRHSTMKLPSETGDAAYCPRSRELVSAGRKGIWAVNFEKGREILLWERGSKGGVSQIAAAPDGETICFLQTERRRLPESYRAEREAQGLPMMVSGNESAVMRLDRATMKAVEMARLSQPILSVDADWDKGLFFAGDGEMGIAQVDLKTGATSRLRTCPEPIGVTVMRGGDLLVWGWMDYGIRRLVFPEGEAVVTTFGRAAACSPDGRRIVFNRKNEGTSQSTFNELWLIEGSDAPSRILSFREPGMSSLPVWCWCGNHFAVQLGFSPVIGSRAPVFLVGDARKRELLTVRDVQIELHGDPVWLPGGLPLGKIVE